MSIAEIKRRLTDLEEQPGTGEKEDKSLVIVMPLEPGERIPGEYVAIPGEPGMYYNRRDVDKPGNLRTPWGYCHKYAFIRPPAPVPDQDQDQDQPDQEPGREQV